MIKRLIINDIKEHKVISIATGIFMTVTAMLFGLSILLFTSLFTSIDDLMTRAGAPDFLQMHTGDISRVQLDAFVQKRDDVRQMQVCPFLNLPNNLLFIGGSLDLSGSLGVKIRVTTGYPYDGRVEYRLEPCGNRRCPAP